MCREVGPTVVVVCPGIGKNHKLPAVLTVNYTSSGENRPWAAYSFSSIVRGHAQALSIVAWVLDGCPASPPRAQAPLNTAFLFVLLMPVCQNNV